jgi:hypothetical protein
LGYTGLSEAGISSVVGFHADNRLATKFVMTFPVFRKHWLARAVFFLAVFLFGSAPTGPGNGFGSSPQDQQTPQAKEKGKLGGAARTRQKSTKEDERLHLQGVLVEGGAECQRFRTENNTFYTLEGDLHGFRTGDRVKITGVISQVSHCMQDTPFRVISIERAKPPASGTRKELRFTGSDRLQNHLHRSRLKTRSHVEVIENNGRGERI